MLLNNNLELKKVSTSAYKTKLYDKEYKYYVINLKKGKSIKFKTINVGTIIPLIFSANSKILFNNETINFKKKICLEFSKKQVKIENIKGNITFLIAGIKKKISDDYKIISKERSLYKVIKPWGYEIWINGQKNTYSIKKIFIKKNFKTSLQYHKKKIETNFLIMGKAKLYFSKKNGKNSTASILNNLQTINLKSNDVINVKKFAIHRIQAKSNIKLYEVSTPHLDDVIRIIDDNNRKSGRINAEHVKIKG